MSDELAEIERLAGSILRSLSSGQRRNLMRRMGRDLARSNRDRITAQREPDGAAFAPRKAKQPPITGRGAACFIYDSGGRERRVIMKSFTWEDGRKMTGFDIEAGGIRTFQFDKVVKWLPVPDEHRNKSGGTLRRRDGLRRKAMFRRFATAHYLRSQADDRGFWVGFSDKAAQIASVHHHGLRDRPSLRAKAIDYPRRELIGAVDADREHLLDLLYAHLADA